jgi:hypothetical protein
MGNVMWIVPTLASLALIILILVDGFEAMVLPRRVTRLYRPARLYYRSVWTLWRMAARRILPGKRREAFLSVFGPLSTLGLFGTWVSGLIIGFGLLHWSLGTVTNVLDSRAGLTTYLYLSGTTFFTLGYGDVTAVDTFGRFLTVFESGMGFGFLAVIIGYLPVLYQAFSRREVSISLLDARAGSPPAAGQVLIRLGQSRHADSVHSLLAEWERWSAEVLESHLSFPVLSYYRSQHDNQSWLAALTAVLDTCSLLIVGIEGVDAYQAQLTFAMARHAVVDLALVFKTPPLPPEPDRLPIDRLRQLREKVCQAGLEMRDDPAVENKLAELRAMYEPFVNALAGYFLFSLPPYLPEGGRADNWQTSAWTRRTVGIGRLSLAEGGDEHFE